jgi:hypothetical protein
MIDIPHSLKKLQSRELFTRNYILFIGQGIACQIRVIITDTSWTILTAENVGNWGYYIIYLAPLQLDQILD